VLIGVKLRLITEDHEWVETIGKTAYEICNDLARDRMTVHY